MAMLVKSDVVDADVEDFSKGGLDFFVRFPFRPVDWQHLQTTLRDPLVTR